MVCTKKQYNSSWYLRDHVVQEYVGVKLQLVILTWLKWKEEPNKAVLKYILHALCAVSFQQNNFGSGKLVLNMPKMCPCTKRKND